MQLFRTVSVTVERAPVKKRLLTGLLAATVLRRERQPEKVSGLRRMANSVRCSRLKWAGILVIAIGLGIAAFYLACPDITVTHPDGGDEWVTGQTYDIRWESRGVRRVDIYLAAHTEPRMSKPLCTRIATDIPASRGAFAWSIPEDTDPQDTVWIVIVRAGFHPMAGLPEMPPTGHVAGWSGSFDIVRTP